MLREWLLSRQCQLTAQAVVGVLATAVFTVARPLHFPHACLAPVFAVIIITALAQDQHVGSRIQVTALLMGPAWLAVLLAMATMSLAKLAENPQDPWSAGYMTAATLLGLLGLAVLILVRAAAPPGPARLMGVLAAVIYGIIVLLSVAVSSLHGFLVNAVGYVVLAMVVAAAVSLFVGLLVAPSLATDEVIRLTAEALQGAGTILSYHTSVLMADQHGLPPSSTTVNAAAAAPAAGAPAAKATGVHITAHATHAAPAAKQGRAGSTDGAELAAAAAAAHVAVAREHEHATLDWVDEEGEQQQTAPVAAAAAGYEGPRSSAKSSAGSSSSTGRRSSSLSSLDSLADAAARAAAAAVEGRQQWPAGAGDADDASTAAQQATDQVQQQQQGQRLRLSEQLLAGLQAAGGEQQQEGSREHLTTAWVAAAAAAATVDGSRRSSLNLDLLEASSSDDALGPFAAAQLPPGAAMPDVRRSLEHAASLEFVAEMDDQAFLAAMRTLSRSKPYGSTASLQKLAQQPQQQQQQQVVGVVKQQQQQQHSYPKSAPSVVSTTGSMMAEEAVTAAAAVAAGDEAYRRAATTRSLEQQASAMHVIWADAGCSSDEEPAGGVQTAAREHSRLRPSSSSSLLRGLASRSFGSFWGGGDNQQQQQQQRHRRHRSNGVLSSSVGWADLASKDNSTHSDAACCRGFAVGSQQQQPQQQPAVWDQAAPTTAAQLGLLIGRAKAVLPAARLEPHWLRPKGLVPFDADAWATLLEDAELLLVRVSTLEALSDERRLQGLQLHHLQHYRNIADAMAMTQAQLAAFLAHVATAIERQQASQHAPWLAWLLRQGTAIPGKQQRRQQQQQQQHQHQQHQQSLSKLQQPAGQAPASRHSPFAVAAVVAAAVRPDGEAASVQDGVSWSAVLSGLERQGSGISSYLWERKGGWETGRQLLLREIESSVGSYWWAVRRATKKAPVQVPRSREVMTLTFIWPITNGLLDALERIETSAQRVLSTQRRRRQQQQQHRYLPAMNAAAACASNADSKQRGWLARLLQRQEQQGSMQQHSQQQASQGRPRHWPRCLSRMQTWLREQQQWLQPLLKLLAVQPGLQAVRQAVLRDLPHALSSKQGFESMLVSRSFQAGAKLLLATGSTLLLTMLLMVYDARVRSLAPIFGFTSVCLSMQERVEATTEKVVGRILGTIVGACLGLGIAHIPGIFGTPVLLLACIAAAALPLSMLARAEARTGVALALITLLAVALCTYEVVCCTPGAHVMSPTVVFLARMGSVVGACVYVALLNRLLLPWYTSDYALEQMADALEQAAALFERIYTSQHKRMRVAAVAAGALVAGEADEDAAAPAAAAATGSSPKATGAADGDAIGCEPTAAGGGGATGVLDSMAAVADLAALEAGEAALHVALRQEVLRRLVDVQMSLAKDTVSWRRGVLATPQVVLDVLGAMIELVEALACQRLALAPFTRKSEAAAPGAGAAATPSGLLRVSGHCYSVWAQPLHPVWLKVLAAVQDLAAATAQQLRRTHATSAGGSCSSSSSSSSSSDKDELLAKLGQLEACRLELRHCWLDIRTNLHKHVHAGSVDAAAAAVAAAAPGAGAAAGAAAELSALPISARFWPIDSIHFFTFTYGASRVLNKLAGVAQALLAAGR